MKKMISVSLVILLLSLLQGCSGISVETDFDRDTDFSIYRTYEWVKHARETDSRMMQDPLIRKHIMRAVENELGIKGYRKAGRERPDFLVAFHIGSKKRVDVNHYYYGYGPRRRWGGHDVSVNRYREGTLIIDIVDARAKELVWRGWARSVLGGREQAAEDIERSVKAVLKRFPPGSAHR